MWQLRGLAMRRCALQCTVVLCYAVKDNDPWLCNPLVSKWFCWIPCILLSLWWISSTRMLSNETTFCCRLNSEQLSNILAFSTKIFYWQFSYIIECGVGGGGLYLSVTMCSMLLFHSAVLGPTKNEQCDESLAKNNMRGRTLHVYVLSGVFN